jgi:glycosyltransferase involved in cell wall biosynthesis
VNYSVIIPVYNRELLIREALDSVLAQSLPPSEIIVADDGSTDNTLSVVRSLLEERGGTIPWRILELSHSGMAGAVRNRGVEVSKADWIAFLDSDDLWEPEKMTCQDDYSKKNPHCRLIHSREKWLRGSKTISQKKQKHKREGDIFDDALVKCIIGPSTTVIRRELWNEAKGFREDLEIAEDYELWLRITACEMVGYVDSPLITKRAGEWENLSDKYGQIEKFRLHALEQLLISRLVPVELSVINPAMIKLWASTGASVRFMPGAVKNEAALRKPASGWKKLMGKFHRGTMLPETYKVDL